MADLATKPAAANPIDQLTQLIGLFKGQSITQNDSGSVQTNSGGTKTTQVKLNPIAVNALIQQILGGSQGLASLAEGEKSAGLYNSSVHQQLQNDLISRTAQQIAVAGAPTVITESPSTITKSPSSITKTVDAPLGKMSPLTALLGMGAMQVGSRALKRLGVPSLGDFIDSGSDKVLNALGFPAGATGGGGAGAASTVGFSGAGSTGFASQAGNIGGLGNGNNFSMFDPGTMAFSGSGLSGIALNGLDISALAANSGAAYDGISLTGLPDAGSGSVLGTFGIGNDGTMGFDTTGSIPGLNLTAAAGNAFDNPFIAKLFQGPGVGATAADNAIELGATPLEGSAIAADASPWGANLGTAGSVFAGLQDIQSGNWLQGAADATAGAFFGPPGVAIAHTLGSLFGLGSHSEDPHNNSQATGYEFGLKGGKVVGDDINVRGFSTPGLGVISIGPTSGSGWWGDGADFTSKQLGGLNTAAKSVFSKAQAYGTSKGISDLSFLNDIAINPTAAGTGVGAGHVSNYWADPNTALTSYDKALTSAIDNYDPNAPKSSAGGAGIGIGPNGSFDLSAYIQGLANAGHFGGV